MTERLQMTGDTWELRLARDAGHLDSRKYQSEPPRMRMGCNITATSGIAPCGQVISRRIDGYRRP